MTSTDVVVDALTPDDADRCAQLEAVLFPGDDPWSARAFRDELRAGHVYLAARSAGELVGYGGIALLPARLGQQAEAEIHTIGVDPAHQGRGIGRAVLDGLLAAADRIGCDHVPGGAHRQRGRPAPLPRHRVRGRRHPPPLLLLGGGRVHDEAPATTPAATRPRRTLVDDLALSGIECQQHGVGAGPAPATTGRTTGAVEIVSGVYRSDPRQVEVTDVASVNIKPLEDKLVVQASEAETTTASGIVIPDTAKEKPQEGKVLAVGPGRVDDNGNRIPLDVAVGDVVVFSKYGGTEIKYNGEDYLILSSRDVLAVVN